jgi:hypothetical protein
MKDARRFAVTKPLIPAGHIFGQIYTNNLPVNTRPSTRWVEVNRLFFLRDYTTPLFPHTTTNYRKVVYLRSQMIPMNRPSVQEIEYYH